MENKEPVEYIDDKELAIKIWNGARWMNVDARCDGKEYRFESNQIRAYYNDKMSELKNTSEKKFILGIMIGVAFTIGFTLTGYILFN